MQSYISVQGDTYQLPQPRKIPRLMWVCLLGPLVTYVLGVECLCVFKPKGIPVPSPVPRNSVTDLVHIHQLTCLPHCLIHSQP